MTDVRQEESGQGIDAKGSLASHFAGNTWPWIFLIAIVVTGMAYSCTVDAVTNG